MQCFIKTYFDIFFDGNMDDCKTRLELPMILMDQFKLEKEMLFKAFKFSLQKMVNLYADFPLYFKYFGFFILEWVHNRKIFTLKDIFGWVDLSKEKDEDTQEDMKDFWEKICIGYMIYCKDEEEYSDEHIQKFLVG